LGAIAGALLGKEAALVAPNVAAGIGPWLALPSKLFLNLIAPPLISVVVISILQGINFAPHGAGLKRTGTHCSPSLFL
jgi:Na+/H+-dicarboxylate symporter